MLYFAHKGDGKMESVRKRLQEAMEIRGKRQQDLIDEFGFRSSTLSYYLSGERPNPTTKMIYKLATALDVRPEWLMGLDVPMEPTHNADLTKKEFEMVEQIRKLDDYDRGRIAAYLDMFLSDAKYKG